MRLPDRPQAGQDMKASWGRDVVDYLQSLTPFSSPTVKVTHVPGGTTYKAASSRGGTGAADGDFPFRLYRSTRIVGEAVTVYFGVSPASDLWVGISWDKQAITGLLTDATDPEDPGWQAAIAGLCSLKGTLDSTGAITACEIEWGGKLPGETGTGTEITRIKIEDATETVPAYQSKFRVPIARLTSTTTGDVTTWEVEQIATRHLTLMNLNINGKLCLYPLAVY